MNLKLIKEPSTNTDFKREYYVNEKGQRHGEYKAWYDDGQLGIHCYYKNNQRHGEYKQWWVNGKLRTQINYKNDQLHGEYKRWHINGKLIKKCYFKNDEEYTWNEYKRMKIQKILSV